MNHENTVKLLSIQIAAMYGVGLSTFYMLRRVHPDFPQPRLLVGRRHAWDAAEILQWFSTHETKYKQQFDPFNADELAKHTPADMGAASHA